VKPKNNIENTYYIELPKWKRETAQEAKNRKPQNKKDGLQTNHRLWLEENGVFE